MLDQIYPRLILELVKNKGMDGIDVSKGIGLLDINELNNFIYGDLLKLVYQRDTESNIGLHFGRHLLPSTLCDLSLVKCTKRIKLFYY